MSNIINVNIYKNLKQSFNRFPLALLSIFCFTILWFNYDVLPKNWDLELLCQILFIGFLSLLSTQLFRESQKWNSYLAKVIDSLIFIGFASYIYYCSPSKHSIALMISGLLLLILIIPFLKSDAHEEHIWHYNYQVWSQFFLANLLCLVILLGGFTVLASLEYLFNLRLFEDQYIKISIVLYGFFLPLLTVNGIPKDFRLIQNQSDGHKVSVLLEYAITPLVLVFLMILIIYAAKTAALQSLPRGKVSLLVSILGISGSFAYMLGGSGKQSLTRLYPLFRKFFFLFLIIPLILMGVGLNERISQYGVTKPLFRS